MAQHKSDQLIEESVSTRTPDNYEVVMHNDDFTPMDFVTHVLMRYFFHPSSVAESLMMRIHKQGEAVVGVYVYDVALSKQHKVTELARENDYPLRISVRPVDKQLDF